LPPINVIVYNQKPAQTFPLTIPVCVVINEGAMDTDRAKEMSPAIEHYAAASLI
jgi:hypothetical protein